MLWGIILLLLIVWLVAVVIKFTLGGLIHLVLLIAFVVLIVRMLRGRAAPLP